MFASEYKYCNEIGSAHGRKRGQILLAGICPLFLLCIGRMPVNRTNYVREIVHCRKFAIKVNTADQPEYGQKYYI